MANRVAKHFIEMECCVKNICPNCGSNETRCFNMDAIVCCSCNRYFSNLRYIKQGYHWYIISSDSLQLYYHLYDKIQDEQTS
ncbi:MAG: hypothetical protein ACXACY_28705 [Candidatus Hodarchaeales archaeon]|jgi:hypothetical protein